MEKFYLELGRIQKRSLRIGRRFVYNVLKDYIKEYLKFQNKSYYDESNNKIQNKKYQITKKSVKIIPKMCCKELESFIIDRLNTGSKKISIFSEGVDVLITSILVDIIEESKINISHRLREVFKNFKKCCNECITLNNFADLIVPIVKFEIPIFSKYGDQSLKDFLFSNVLCKESVSYDEGMTKVKQFIRDVILNETKNFISNGAINNQLHLWDFVSHIVYLFKRNFSEDDVMEIYERFSTEMLMLSESNNLEVYFEIIARDFTKELIQKNSKVIDSACYPLFGFFTNFSISNKKNDESKLEISIDDYISAYALMSEERFECKGLFVYNLDLAWYFSLIAELYIQSVKNNRINVTSLIYNHFLKFFLRNLIKILLDIFLKCKVSTLVKDISQELVSFYLTSNNELEMKYVGKEEEITKIIFEKFRNWISKNMNVKSFNEVKLNRLIREIVCKARDLFQSREKMTDGVLQIFLRNVLESIIIPEAILNSQHVNYLLMEINNVFKIVVENFDKENHSEHEKHASIEQECLENCCCILDVEILNSVLKKNLIYFSFYWFSYSKLWRILLEGFERIVFSGITFGKAFSKISNSIVKSIVNLQSNENCVSITNVETKSKNISRDCIFDLFKVILYRICYHLNGDSCQKYKIDVLEKLSASVKSQLENEIDAFVTEITELDRYVSLFIRKGYPEFESEVAPLLNYEEIKTYVPMLDEYLKKLGKDFISTFENPVKTFALEYIFRTLIEVLSGICDNSPGSFEPKDIDCLVNKVRNAFSIFSDENKSHTRRNYHLAWLFEVSSLSLQMSEIYIVNQMFEL